jgi:hypothetical protein
MFQVIKAGKTYEVRHVATGGVVGISRDFAVALRTCRRANIDERNGIAYVPCFLRRQAS